VLSVILGTMIGLALGRYRFRGKNAYDLVIFIAISAPELVLGASLLSLFITVQFARGFVTIVIAHVAFSLAFVAVTVRARVLGLGLPWFLLCVATFPMLLLAGWFYVRQAERSEREFAELVERP